MEFTVIDANLIRSNRDVTESGISRTDNGNDSDANRISDFRDVNNLDLSSSNLLHIANLCLVPPSNLTSLRLSVNYIEKICNLDSLVNLVELDLSHNHIQQIENLQALVKLRSLILNHNPINSIQNLDAQRDTLEMLDIGHCEIANIKFTLYLRRFTNLASLIVEGNPLQIEPANSERTFIVSIMQSLLVYNNKIITVEEKNEALETYRKLIGMLEKCDEKRKRRSKDEKLRSERLISRKDAFLDKIPEGEDADFNVSIFRNSTVVHVLNENNRYGIHNVYRTYAGDFRRLLDEITDAAETSRETRARLIDKFHDELRQLIDEGVVKSRKCVSDFAEYRKRLSCDLYGCDDPEVLRLKKTSSSEPEEVVVETFSRRAAAYKRFDQRKHVVWITLMGHEDDMSREITKMIDKLRDILEKQIFEFKQLVNNRFCTLQRQQNVFLQFILEYAVSSAKTDDINNRFRSISQFTNDISECMESQSFQIKSAESHIIESVTKWLNDVLNNLNSEEVQRNRRNILEIATFLRFQEETFNQLSI